MPRFELLFPSKYFKSSSLIDKPDAVLTIDRVERGHELTMAGNKKDHKPVLHFVETRNRARDGHEGAYMLVLNKTNAKVIAKLYGPDYESDWIGNKIALYRIEDTGNSKPGIRVRTRKPQGQGQQQSSQAATPQQPPTREEEPPPAGDEPEPPHDHETGEVFDGASDEDAATYRNIFDALECCTNPETLANVWTEQETGIKSLPDTMQERLRSAYQNRAGLIEAVRG